MIDCSKGQITGNEVNNRYSNDTYYIGSAEQGRRMNRDNAPDMRPQEHYYSSIHNPPVPRTNNSEVALTLSHARAENSSKEFTASIYQPPTAPVYQPINSGDAAPIYQSLNSDTRISDVRADNSSKGTMPMSTN